MREAEIIANTKTPATTADLAHDLASLGIVPGGVVILHSSLSALGFVIGGPLAVIAALDQTLGPDGTLVMPTFSTQLTDPTGWIAPPVPRDWLPLFRDHLPAFDPAATPTRDMGAIPEQFRTLPGVVRSDHPHFSFAARGHHAAAIVADHGLRNAFGETSPLARLYDLDAYVLLLGVGHANNTSLHLAEHRTAQPTRRRERKAAPVSRGGRRIWIEYDDLEYDTGDFVALGAAFAAAGGERQGPVAQSVGRLMRQRALVDFAIRWIEANR